MIKLPQHNWHFEVSSICALKCPRCPRSEIPEDLINDQLNLNFFEKQITAKRILEMKNIIFCGNDGDPIYCKEFLEICEFIKKINPMSNIRIFTNGSYKHETWWTRLGKILNENDQITWSLDGWNQESNNTYRINSNWNSIIKGIKSFFEINNSTYRVWGIIPFSFNEEKIDYIASYATTLGFDQLRITKSNKFGIHNKKLIIFNIDPLQPKNLNLIAEKGLYNIQIVNLTERKQPEYLYNSNHVPEEFKKRRCLLGKQEIFINSRGEFYPCCWSGNRYSHNYYWQTLAKEKFNLNKKTLDEILEDNFWKTDFLKFESKICNIKCNSF